MRPPLAAPHLIEPVSRQEYHNHVLTTSENGGCETREARSAELQAVHDVVPVMGEDVIRRPSEQPRQLGALLPEEALQVRNVSRITVHGGRSQPLRLNTDLPSHALLIIAFFGHTLIQKALLVTQRVHEE